MTLLAMHRGEGREGEDEREDREGLDQEEVRHVHKNIQVHLVTFWTRFL